MSTNYHRPQVLFNVFNSLVNPCDTARIVPSPTLCEDFLKYFTDKISALRSKPTPSAMDPSVPPICPAVFDQFEPVTLSSLSEVVKHLRPASCPLDSIPAHLLKEVFNTVGSTILTLVNTSLSSGCVPDVFKHAVVQPLIKKNNLDPSALSNFRPISKLPFLSEVLEKVVITQLQTFYRSF